MKDDGERGGGRRLGRDQQERNGEEGKARKKKKEEKHVWMPVMGEVDVGYVENERRWWWGVEEGGEV